MTRGSDAGGGTGRRTFLKAVGAAGVAGAATAAAGTASATELGIVDDALDFATATPQEALVVFGDDDAGKLDSLAVDGYHEYEALPIAYTRLTGDQLRTVAGWDDVTRIAANHELRYRNDESQVDTRTAEVWKEYDYRGSNVEVAIIDGGVDGKHPGLVSNLVANYHWAGDPTSYEMRWVDTRHGKTSALGHGTHCAGSLAGTGTGSVTDNYAGMAPEASLTGYAFSYADVAIAVAAFDHLITTKEAGEHDIQLVTNSWGYPGGYQPWDPVPVAAYYAFQTGIIPFWAAGNQGESGVLLRDTQPAPYVVSVAAVRGDMSVADFSTRGWPDRNHNRKVAFENIRDMYDKGVPASEVDEPLGVYRETVGAHGVSVMSTQSPDDGLYGLGKYSAATSDDETEAAEPLYAALSGTSMASPTTAGCAAVFLDAYYEVHGEFPDPVDTINTLEATANATAHPDDGGESDYSTRYTRANVGSGYVDARAAVERAIVDDLATFEEVNEKIADIPRGELPAPYQ